MADRRIPIDRLMAKVSVDDNGCWLWVGATAPNGYGHFGVERRTVSTHRWSYEYHMGPMPDGLQIDHLCRVRSCCNPAHLEPVTPRENTMRGETITAAHAAQTHCKRGHEFTEENTIPVPKGRSCRECGRTRSREYIRAKRKAAA